MPYHMDEIFHKRVKVFSLSQGLNIPLGGSRYVPYQKAEIFHRRVEVYVLPRPRSTLKA